MSDFERSAEKMSQHFHRLRCGSRCMLILAERRGVEISADDLWQRFSSELERNEEEKGSCFVSHLLDVARAYRIAHHMDVTHDVLRARAALQMRNVAGVLLTVERGTPRQDGTPAPTFSHIMVVSHIQEDKDRGTLVHCDSPHDQGIQPARFVLSADHLPAMLAAFVILIS